MSHLVLDHRIFRLQIYEYVLWLLFQGVEINYNNPNAKRSKQTEVNKGNDKGSPKTEEETNGNGNAVAGDDKQAKSSPKPPEPPKDYIHVRARRGQATDSHSLAERVTLFGLSFTHKPTYRIV